MIALGRIQLQHRSAVYDARNKIRALAQALGYGPIAVTRLTTAVSEAARVLRRESLDSGIAVALATDVYPAQLVLDFESPGESPHFPGLAGFFDRVSKPGAEQGGHAVRALKWLPQSVFKASDEFVEEQRSRIQSPSREQLNAEIERKNRDLERHSAELEQTVARRTEQLELAIREADTANKAKGDFLANMSHEIRTPMNAIIGLSDLCLRTEMTEKQQDYLSKIHGSAISLLGIINDILDFSKIEAGKLDLECIEFDIDQVLDNLATIANAKAQEKGLELIFKRDPRLPAVLVGDPLRLGQVLINLTNNAIKFTEEGEVVVQVELARLSGARATLEVAIHDTGIGMNEEQLGRLFKSFSQADISTTRKYGGTGLGLAISKQLVEVMGGEIDVSSEPGQGSTFRFSAGFDVAENAQAQDAVAEAVLQGKRVLAVDDNATAREVLVTYLRSLGLKVEEAASGEEALRRIETTAAPYDLFVLDWLMPGMTGLELAQSIRYGESAQQSSRIVMVSAFNSGDLSDKPGGDCIDRFIAKPLSPSMLEEAINSVLGVGPATGRDSQRTSRHSDMEDLRPVQGARILLVEDNEINQQVARELLQQARFIVEIANQGREALTMLENQDYDCVLMDIQMPVMDGFTATTLIRKQPQLHDLPVLAMTANATVEDRERALQAGMNDHIAKPINPRALFSALLQWIEHGDRPLPAAVDTSHTESSSTGQDVLDLPGINTSAGISRVSGNLELYRKLLHKFQLNYAASMEEIGSTFSAGDAEASIRLAHTLKGVAGNVGAETLQALLAKLEPALKAGQDALALELISQAQEELQRVVGSIREISRQDHPPQQPAATQRQIPTNISAQLQSLLDKLEQSDTDAEDVLENIVVQLHGTPVKKLFDGLEQHIGQYEFDEAAQQVKELIRKIGGA